VTEGLDLSVVIPALHEGPNISLLVPALREVLGELQIRHEILVVSPGADRNTIEAAAGAEATAVVQEAPGYGGALATGFARARGAYILTMDADLSHRPIFVRDLWAARGDAEITIASRYVPGGSAKMPAVRRVLSRILNVVFSRGLALPLRDMSSGFRLYKASVVRGQPWRGRHFDILQEILVRTYAEGWRVQEKPFDYAPRAHGSSQARVFGFGLAYLRTFWRLWTLRNSILAADYDDRAHDSVIPLQRYWQRQRFRHVTGLIPDDRPVLDMGCGSSRIIGALPPGSVGVDILLRKLRHARRFSRFLVQASGFGLPFPDHSFSCVVCSQVIEHVPKDTAILDELCRVLAPGGRLILGTPDYDRWEWVVIEKLYGLAAPGGYADEHIAHYTRRELIDLFARRGFAHEATRYILRGELILAFRKPDRSPPLPANAAAP
jgi:dolichol-phosphate mannosyltransferase